MAAVAEAPLAALNEPGQTLAGGEYELLGLIGRGATASVYRARSRSRGCNVAVKVLFPPFAEDPAYREWFLGEGDRLAQLRHPNLVEVFDCAEDAGLVYLAMALAPRGTLRQRAAAEGGPLPLPVVARSVAGISAALDYLHHQGALHLDVKPGNILLGEGDWPLLADFGVPHLHDRASGGTPAYMAPEQSRGEALTGRADQYALAATARELLTGGGGADLPPEIAPVLHRALADDREARYPTAAAFGQAFAHASGAASVALAPSAAGFGQVFSGASRRWPAAAVVSPTPAAAIEGASTRASEAGGLPSVAGRLRLLAELWLADAFLVAIAHGLGLPPLAGWLVQAIAGAASLACLLSLAGFVRVLQPNAVARGSLWLALLLGLVVAPVVDLVQGWLPALAALPPPSPATLADAATGLAAVVFLATSWPRLAAVCNSLAGELVRRVTSGGGLRLTRAAAQAWRRRLSGLAQLATAALAALALVWILQPALYQLLPAAYAALAALAVVCLSAVGFLPRVTAPSQWFAPHLEPAAGLAVDEQLFGPDLPASAEALARRVALAGAATLAAVDAALLLGLTFLLPPALAELWPADAHAFWWAAAALAAGLLAVPIHRLRKSNGMIFRWHE